MTVFLRGNLILAMLTLLILYGGVYSLFYSFSYLFYPRSILLFLRTLAAKHCSSKTTSAWQNGGRPPRTGGACSADLRGRAGYAYRLSNAHSAWQARRGCVPPLYFGAKLFLRGRAAKHGLASRTGGLNPTLFPTTGGSHGRVGSGKILPKNFTSLVLDVILRGFHFGARLKLFLHGRAVIIVPPKQTAWQNSI